MACIKGRNGLLSFIYNICSKKFGFCKNCANIFLSTKLKTHWQDNLWEKSKWRGLLACNASLNTFFKVHIWIVACNIFFCQLNITLSPDCLSICAICWNNSRIVKIRTFLVDDILHFTICWCWKKHSVTQIELNKAHKKSRYSCQLLQFCLENHNFV